ncbi:EFR1 family ferrodoxin [Anaerosphaera multitolerans]|uniref:4Fe-4S dicluster domain-containing protein n=1 Tax=Anaerosphaera multitolerans TaxID=2487351 RepID=A0A437S7Y3_9FIRM|nr:EFR1 family ferrodoxin [Anaerosphaera multitolerans]RVU55034.1 4Fe-4S dicluster domain-containing protein [Anaerosphaera multitolerans]
MKRINLIYFSPSGSSNSIASEIGDNFSGDKVRYDLLRQTFEEVTFEKNELVIFAFPVFAGRLPAICLEKIAKFKGKDTPAIGVVVYGNRDYEDALVELVDILKENGFKTIGAGAVIAEHSIFPTMAKGRPDEKDREQILNFSNKCKDMLSLISEDMKIEVKGNRPYIDSKPIPLIPKGNSKCIKCGACVKICPVGAISIDDPKKTDKKKCISCTACIYICPERARGFSGPMYAAAAKTFESKNKERKEPEFFYADK